MLKSIVALLVALADLAEIASGRSLVACRLMQFLLRPAEIAVQEFVVGPSDAWPMDVVRSGDARADIVKLAMRLRELACLLCCEADLVLSPGPRVDAAPVHQPRCIGRITRSSDRFMMLGLALSAPAPDTS